MEKEIQEENLKAKEEVDVSKVVFKTALITVLIFLLVVLLSFCIIALASPKTVSDSSYKIGAMRISARFAAAQYERSKDINDLGVAVERSITAKNYKNTAKYAKVLVEFKSGSGTEQFIEFAKHKDRILNKYYADNKIDMKSDYYTYIYGNYVYALYKTKDKTGAYEIAIANTSAIDYTANNMITMYIDAYIADKNRGETELFVLLEEMFDSLDYVNDEYENLCAMNICLDLSRLYTVFQDEVKAQMWQAKFYEYNHSYI